MSAGNNHGRQERRQALELSNEAAAYLRQGKPEKALPLLRRAIELDPDEPNVLLNLGGTYVLLGRHEEAVAVLTRATEVAPDEEMIWANLGAALLRLPAERQPEDELRAIAAFERALAINSRAPHAAYNLGLIFRDRGEWKEAARCFRLALAADPEDKDAKSLLRQAEEHLAGPDEAAGAAGDEGEAV